MSNKYSYSKIETYNSCPFKYKLQYDDGNYVFIGSIATEFGTAVHEAEEAIAMCIQAGEAINYIKIKNDFILKILAIESKYYAEYHTPDTKSGRTYKEKAYEYLSNGIYRLEKYVLAHPTYKIVGIEQKFIFNYNDNYTFNGAIDRIFFDEATDSYLIHDIKTYSVEMKKEDLTTPLQFVIYSLAVTQMFNCPIDKIRCEYDLPLVDCVQPGGTKGYIERGKAKLDKLFSGIENNIYEPKPSALCNYCNFCITNPDAVDPYKHLCPYFCIWDRTTRNKYDLGKVENSWDGQENHKKIYEEFLKKYNINVQQTT